MGMLYSMQQGTLAVMKTSLLQCRVICNRTRDLLKPSDPSLTIRHAVTLEAYRNCGELGLIK